MKAGLTFNRLKGITSKTTVPFIATAVRISNPGYTSFHKLRSKFKIERILACHLHMKSKKVMSTIALTWNGPGGVIDISENGVGMVWCFQNSWDTTAEKKIKVKIRLL
jgi:hypothetical protein